MTFLVTWRIDHILPVQIVDVIHPHRPNVPKTELAEMLAKKYKAEPGTVCLMGFRTAFGGGKSSGFCLIYNSLSGYSFL